MHYHVLGLNESKSYRKLALRYNPNKNKHSQDSDVMHMINKAKEGLEDLLHHNIGIYDNHCENLMGKCIPSR